MPLAYIDASGFHRERLDAIFAYLQAAERGIYGSTIDLSVDSIDGQALMRRAEDIDSFLSLAEAIFNGRSPAGAVGAQLSRIVRLNGVTRTEPEHSTGEVTLTGTNGTVIPAGSRIANEDDATAIFETLSVATISGGTATVDVRSIDAGPIPGPAGKLTVIMTVISGWDSVTNADAVSLGSTGEMDAQLRARRAASVALPSQGIVDGLRAALLQVEDVTQVVVRENPEDTIQILDDGGGLAPHAIQVIVKGGADQDIADVMWLKKSMGVTMVGLEEAEVVDSQGVSHTMKYDRPTDLPIYVAIESPDTLDADTKQAIRDEIVSWGEGNLSINGVPIDGPQIGEDLEYAAIWEPITSIRIKFPSVRISAVFIGTAPSPTDTDDIDVPFNFLATFEIGNIGITP